MRNVILAAALAAAFSLSLTSHAQQGGGAGGSAAPAGGATAPSAGGQGAPGATQGGGAGGQGAPGATQGGAAGIQGGPPTSGSFSVQGQSLGTEETGAQAGSTGAGATQAAPATGTQAPGATVGTGGGGAAGGAQAGWCPCGPGQAGTGGAGATGTGQSGAAAGSTATGTGTGGSAALTPEAAQAELARLQAEVNRLRTELDNARAVREEGTGGAGSEEELDDTAVATVTFEGRVSDVTRDAIEVIDYETGEPYVLRLTEDSRARRGQRNIPVTAIREGSEVRASFDYISGDTIAKEIDVLRSGRR